MKTEVRYSQVPSTRDINIMRIVRSVLEERSRRTKAEDAMSLPEVALGFGPDEVYVKFEGIKTEVLERHIDLYHEYSFSLPLTGDEGAPLDEAAIGFLEAHLVIFMNRYLRK